jgi:2-polyprenyl-6-methoxyphenol hydroxylase-like FAD-dependent oxidoreductase
MNKTVLISGASVAGPALAFWLERYGYDVTVIEQAPAPRPGGYAVDFRGASLRVLDRMGLLAAVEAKATHMGDMYYVNKDGKKLATSPAGNISGELEILRGDLVEILYDATRARVRYEFDDSITSLRQDATGVDVTFERGAPRRFDLVVGADGLHSNVRGLAFGEEKDFIHELGFYASVSTVENHLGLDHSGLLHNSPGKTIGTYSAKDNTEAKALFYFASEPLDNNRRDIATQKQIVTETFEGEGWETPKLLEGMRQAPDFYFDSVSQIKLDSYSNGRVALVGDAGYCASSLSGMGTSLGIVGAYVLAGELHAAAGNHIQAFSEYDEVMREFVKACQKQGVDGAMWFIPSSRWFAAFRNLNFRMMPYLPWRKVIEEMPVKVGNKVELRDYAARSPQPAVLH